MDMKMSQNVAYHICTSPLCLICITCMTYVKDAVCEALNEKKKVVALVLLLPFPFTAILI